MKCDKFEEYKQENEENKKLNNNDNYTHRN